MAFCYIINISVATLIINSHTTANLNNHPLAANPPIHQDTSNNGNVHHEVASTITSHTPANLSGHSFDADTPIYQDANDNGNVHDFTGITQLVEKSHIIPNICNTYHCH